MFSIHPLAEEDLTTIVDIAAASKLALVVNRILWNDWPNAEVQKGLSLQASSNTFHSGQGKMLKAVDDETGQILGSIVLSPRLTEKKADDAAAAADASASAAPQQPPIELPKELNMDVLAMVEKCVGEARTVIEGKDHIEITAINVRQFHRSKGIGTKLMSHAYDYARSQNLPLFTVSEPAARDFFAKVGLRELQYADMDLRDQAPPNQGFGPFRLTAFYWEDGQESK